MLKEGSSQNSSGERDQVTTLAEKGIDRNFGDRDLEEKKKLLERGIRSKFSQRRGSSQNSLQLFHHKQFLRESLYSLPACPDEAAGGVSRGQKVWHMLILLLFLLFLFLLAAPPSPLLHPPVHLLEYVRPVRLYGSYENKKLLFLGDR